MDLSWSYPLIVASVLYCASGVGGLILGEAPVGNRVRSIVAQYVVGFLAYAAAFGLAAQVGLPFGIAAAVIAAAGVLGLVACLRSARSARAPAAARPAVALALGASLFTFGATPLPVLGGDAVNYAYTTARMFHEAWSAAHGAELPPYRHIEDIHRGVVITRAPAEAVLWPPTALGLGLEIGAVPRTAAWLLAVAFVLTADTLHGFAPLPTRLVLAAGGIGAFSLTSALHGGQINQAFALVASTAAVWLCRHAEGQRARLAVLALTGNIVAGAYPEFLVALPLYLACIAVLDRRPFRARVAEAVAAVLGVVLVQVSTQLDNARYLLYQSSAVPGWRPLPADPASLTDVWAAVLLQGAPAWWLVAGLVPIGLFAWRFGLRTSPTACPPTPVGPALAGLALMVAVWSWAVTRGDNWHYATFKLGAWLGPGLVCLGWLLLRPARSTARWAIGSALLTVAAVRALHLGDAIPPAAPSWVPEVVYAEDHAGSPVCVVRAISDRADILMRAIAESAAPTRGCAIAVSGTAATAALYQGDPPASWRPSQRQNYLIRLINGSSDTWQADGPGSVQLAVRFLTPDGAAGASSRHDLYGPLGPGGSMTLRVRTTAPRQAGSYLLEHRVIKRGGGASEQALVEPVMVGDR